MQRKTFYALMTAVVLAVLVVSAMPAVSSVETQTMPYRNPREYKRLPNATPRVVTASVVKNGLLPPIKPLMDVQMRDPSLCVGGDGNYYLTGSTGTNIWDRNDGIELWRSKDLKTWEWLGLVWSIEKDGTWEKEFRELRGKPIRSVWAPEVHYIKGNYWLIYSMAPGGLGLVKSSTGKPEGPYVRAFPEDKPISANIDGTLFQDDDGKVYLAYLNSRIARMKDDMSGLAEPFRQITLADPDHTPSHHAKKCVGRGMNDIGHEGICFFKQGGKYYVNVADDYEGRYSSIVAVADNIYGPYRLRHEALATGGHNSYFKDKSGGLWATYFGNDNQAPWRERPALVKMEIEKDGKLRPAKEQPLSEKTATTKN